ncbi:MAG: hypothetical protein ACD_11C00004G0034 [uncultured bacterium]|nr:MAG: hypothetical protein ACD_11C00004G0034 [uncultured bacterium]
MQKKQGQSSIGLTLTNSELPSREFLIQNNSRRLNYISVFLNFLLDNLKKRRIKYRTDNFLLPIGTAREPRKNGKQFPIIPLTMNEPKPISITNFGDVKKWINSRDKVTGAWIVVLD